MDRRLLLTLITASLALSACQKASMKSVAKSSEASPTAATPGTTVPADDTETFTPPINPNQQDVVIPEIEDENSWQPAPPPRITETRCTGDCDGPKRVEIPDEPEEPVCNENNSCPKRIERLYCEQPEFKRIVEKHLMDILFVVDTSKSMRGGDSGKNSELVQIAKDFDTFVSKLPENTDYNVGVILGHGPKSDYHGRLFNKGGGDKDVINYGKILAQQGTKAKAKTEIARLLKEKMLAVPNDKAGTFSQGETLLLSLYNALKAKTLKSLIRPGAQLAVIFISDEQDVCYDYSKGSYKPVGPDGKKGVADPNEVKAYDLYCKKAVDGRALTPGDVYNALVKEKGEGNLYLTGAIYTTENIPVAANDENEMGHGFIELISEWGHDRPIDLRLIGRGTDNLSFAKIFEQMGAAAATKSSRNDKFWCHKAKIKPEQMEAKSIRLEIFVKGESFAIYSSDCKVKAGCGNDTYPLYTEIRANANNGGKVQLFTYIDPNFADAMDKQIGDQQSHAELSYMPKASAGDIVVDSMGDDPDSDLLAPMPSN